MQIPIEEIIFGNPVLTIALGLLVIYLVHLQKNLMYREYRFLHILKCWLCFFLDSRIKRNLVRDVPQGDFVMDIDKEPREIYRKLSEEFSPHLIATAKRRNGSDWSHSQLVQMHDDERQTEAILFGNDDGTTTIYGHYETSVTNPEGHVSDEQEHGDHLGAIEKTLTNDFA